jgi:hypothetical protein
LFNIFYLIYFLHYITPIGGYVLSLSSNIILFILPGLAWENIFKHKPYKCDLVARILVIFFISLLICLTGLIGCFLLHIRVTSFSQAIFLAVITNIGLLLKWPNQEKPKGKGIKNYSWAIVACFILYTLAYFFSTYVADEPFEDSDLDLQGTSYSLVNYLTPRMLTDRKTFYNFSHPLLPAFCAANTILLFDDLDKLKYYYDASLEAEKITNEEPSIGRKIIFISSEGIINEVQIKRIDKNGVTLSPGIIRNVKYDYGRNLPEGETFIDYNLIKEAKIWRVVEDCYKRFFKSPNLVATRSPQFLFTALTGLVLALFLFKITSSLSLSLLGSIFYLAIPEIFIGQSSTNYMALTNFTLMMAAYLYYVYICDNDEKEKMKLPLFLSGFLCAIANQKTLILFLAILMKDIISGIKGKEKDRTFRIIYKDYSLMGFTFGIASYWFYGTAIHPHCFFMDHLRHHLFDRIFHINPLGYPGFFSVNELWVAYSGNLGRPFFWLALFAVVYYLKYVFTKEKNEAMLSLWFIFGAVAFTLIDFRQTLHLIYVTIPLIILTMRWISERKGFLRTLFIFILTYVLISNIRIVLEFIIGVKDIRSYLLWL